MSTGVVMPRTSKRLWGLVGLTVIVSLMAAACGGDDGGAIAGEPEGESERTATAEPVPEPESESAPQSDAEPASEPEVESEPAAAPESESEPDATGPVAFDSLSDFQQHVVGGICQASLDFETSGAFSFAPEWANVVLVGESGVPALEEAFAQVGDVRDPSLYLDGTGTICEGIGWAPAE